ncbi:snare associated Golgi protein-domain-containing protein [Boletus coccyginus]|nr:snare associated Golgi protein-domain-containing protein [Boletus coccyginus]
MALVVPPPNRSRASSTCVRPALSINTLGRRRSSSLVLPVQHSDPTSDASHPAVHSPHSSSVTTSQPSMLSLIAAKCLEFLHVPKLHPSDFSTPSSPRSASDLDLVLPLSASSQSTFSDILNEKVVTSHRWRPLHPTAHAPILLVMLLFPLSTAVVFLSLYSLPISVTWPRTLAELAELGRELQKYSQLGPGPCAHVIGVLSVTAAWKHAWSIPGSVIWNVLAGALFHPLLATLLLTFLTTIGSVIATALSAPLAPVLSRFFPRALDMTRNALEGETDLASGSAPKSPAWVRLSILRLIGVVPWSGINIACGVCGVPLTDCFLGAFIGGLPWTAVTCQIGDILQTVASAPSPDHQTVSSLLASPDIILKLVFLSFLSLAPILGRDRLRAFISKKSFSHLDASQSVRNERLSRWVRDWKTKIRTHSRSHNQDVKRFDDLVQEKPLLP